MKVLGNTFDDKLTFNSHVTNVCCKATNIYKQCSRAAESYIDIIKIIYTATIEPMVLYTARALAAVAEKLVVQRQSGAVQRGIMQKLCRAYRKVSLSAALALAGMLPLDLRFKKVASLYKAKKGVS